MKTTAIVFTGIGEVTVKDIDMPEPAADEVQIQTEVSVISVGTERWALMNEFTWSATPFPCVPGYQRVGVITKLGSAVTDLKVGQRVLATVGSWLGEIRPFWGSHIAVCNSPRSEVYELPDNMDAVDAAGCVVTQVGFNAASRVAMMPGDWVIVYGDGLIGQCAAQAARARGAQTVIVGHREERIRLARNHSADFVVDGHREDVVQAVFDITLGNRVTAIIDTVQKPDVQRAYTPLLNDGAGQIVYSGFTPGQTWADMAALQQHAFTCHFVSGWNRTRMQETIRFIEAGQIRILPLVTHRESFRNGEELYQMICDNREPYLGIAIDWR